MSEANSNTRRKVLAGLGGGLFGATQMPKSWTKPVVDSVLLPVHAKTTDDSDLGAPAIGPDFYGDISFVHLGASDSFIQDVLSVVVEDAHAGFTPAQGEMCIKVTPPAGPGAAYTATVLIADGILNGVYTGTGTVGGGAINLSFDTGCDNGVTNTLDVTAVSAAGAAYKVLNKYSISWGTLPPGTDCPADSTCKRP